jgi:UDP-glucose 4-epimerase
MKRILVIGSEGFLGNQIATYFSSAGCEVLGIDNRGHARSSGYKYERVLNFSYSLENVTGNWQPEICVFAGGSANVQLSVTQPHLDFESNVTTVSRLLASLLKMNKNCRFIHISSAAVYGDPARLPVEENAELKPVSPYGWHKLQAEKLCSEYFQCFGLPTCSLRPFSVYGEGQKKLLFWDLAQKISSGEKIELYGTGDETRDFVHVSDFLRALELIIQKGEFKGDVYNIASGIQVTVKDAADLMNANFTKPATITFNGKTREGDPKYWQADIGKIRGLGFSPALSLKDGLKKYQKWLSENA